MPDPSEEPPGPPWEELRQEVAADVRRVSDRLRTLSATRLAAPPAPSKSGGPAYASRAAAGRAAAAELARASLALEAAAEGPPDREVPDLPHLPDLAVGDQVAVTGNDLVAAMDLVGPDAVVRTAAGGQAPAQTTVRAAARALVDVRRRL